ncbi:MAG: hypothetical protein JKY33_00120, partial [Bacteroidia bacterium]|nr:hypothetical protein [Bacteroidia bacterium]
MRGITVFAILISVIALSAFVIEQNDESCTAKSRNSRKSAGPPPYYTGEPPEYASCGAAGCHDGVTSTTNTGPGITTLDLGEANDGFELDKSYTITISLSRSGMVKSGFQIIALLDDYDEYSPGTVTLIDTNRTQIRDKSNVSWGCCWENRVWIEHKYDGITPIADDYNE